MSVGFAFAQLLTGLANASSLFLVAAGLSLIFGVTRVVNFAHGSLYMLGAYVAFTVASAAPWGFWPGVLVAAVTVAALGAAIEILVLRRLYRVPDLFQLVATFGLVLVIQDAALWIFGPEDQLGPRAPGFTGVVRILGEPIPSYDLALVAIAPAVLLVTLALLHRTRWGLLLRAATADREMVGALGVDQRLLFTAAFTAGAFLAGLGGALQVPREPVNLLMDLNVIAEAFVVVVTGGMGSLVGAYAAAVLISVANAFGVLVLPQVSLLLPFLVMAAVLIVRPHGLLGVPDAAARTLAPETPLRRRPLAAPLFAAAVLGAALLPLAADPYALTLGADVLVAMLTAASLHLLMGIGGLVSFGHAAYFGLGAYGAAVAATLAGLPMLPAMGAGVAAGALGGAVFGLFSLRLSGVYLAMLSLAFAQVLWGVTFQWRALGGDDGIRGVWPDAWAGRTAYYLLALALCTTGLLAIRRIAFAPLGYALRAGRDSALRAEAIGIDVGAHRWLAFAVAGGCAGLAGAVFAFARGSVFPEALGISRSVDALVMVLLGGVRSLFGPLVGGATFTLLRAEIESLAYWRAILGLGIILIAVAAPNGIVGAAASLRRRFR